MLHHVRKADILAQHPPARHNQGGHSLAVEFGGMEGAIRAVIVIAEDNQGIGRSRVFIDHPKLSGEPHQRVSDGESQEKKPDEEHQE